MKLIFEGFALLGFSIMGIKCHSKSSVFFYHLGRLMSYCGLGAISGTLGQLGFSETYLGLNYITGFIIGNILIMIGISFFLSLQI